LPLQGLERQVVEPDGFLVGRRGCSLLGGAACGVDRLGDVTRRRRHCVVVGEIGQVVVQPRAQERFDGLRGPQVQTDAANLKDVRVRGVPHDLVGEPVAIRACALHQARVHRLL